LLFGVCDLRFMFSTLQQFILERCYESFGKKLDRKVFENFYNKNSGVKTKIQVNNITQSLERLIDRGMLVGYGVRTPKKWFIKEVRMTALGKKNWGKWLNRKQDKLKI